MPRRIFTPVSSLNAPRLLDLNASRTGRSIERVADGIRINRGSGDAGRARAQSLRSDTRALRHAVRSTREGVALLHVAAGALNEQSRILIRLRELSSQASSGTLGDSERQFLQLEFSALRSEFDRIAATTEFNGRKLLDGSLDSKVPRENQLIIQVGLQNLEDHRINLNTEINIGATTRTGLGFIGSSIATIEGALTALGEIENAITPLTRSQGKIETTRNHLLRTLSHLNITLENLTAAASTPRDANLAEEIALLTRNLTLTELGGHGEAPPPVALVLDSIFPAPRLK